MLGVFGQGETLEAILADSTVEGVPTAEVAIHYADMCGLELPLFRTVGTLNDALAVVPCELH